jgi:hypothetical protein
MSTSGQSTGLAPNPHVSFGSPLTRPSSVANDGYDYYNEGPAPEDKKTEDPVRKSPTNLSDELETHVPISKPRKFDGPALRIFTRPIDGAWRPRVPRASKDDQVTLGSRLSNHLPVSTLEILHGWTRQDIEDETRLSLTVLDRGPPSTQLVDPGHIKWM